MSLGEGLRGLLDARSPAGVAVWIEPAPPPPGADRALSVLIEPGLMEQDEFAGEGVIAHDVSVTAWGRHFEGDPGRASVASLRRAIRSLNGYVGRPAGSDVRVLACQLTGTNISTVDHELACRETYDFEVLVTDAPDDPDPEIIAPAQVTIREGNSIDVQVVLSRQPAGTAEVAVSVTGHGISVAPAMLTFGERNWGTPQTVTVSAERDPTRVDVTGVLTLTASGAFTAAREVSVDVDDVFEAVVYTDSSATVQTTRGVRSATLAGGASQAIPDVWVQSGSPSLAGAFASGGGFWSLTLTGGQLRTDIRYAVTFFSGGATWTDEVLAGEDISRTHAPPSNALLEAFVGGLSDGDAVTVTVSDDPSIMTSQ